MSNTNTLAPPYETLRPNASINESSNSVEDGGRSSITASQRHSILVQHRDVQKITIRFGRGAAQEQSDNYPDNSVRTTKYTAVSWLPKSLLLQFNRVANIYFLIISILQCLPFSPKNPVSMILTFVAVLMVTSLKEGYEDYSRYKEDQATNHQKVLRFDYDKKSFEEELSKNLQVGDLVKVLHNQDLPADILLVKSSRENGICYVDTISLDGESFLKERVVAREMRGITDDQLIQFNGRIETENASEYLDYWDGTLHFNNNTVGLDNKQLLLSGTVLRNTSYIIGIVIYTGVNTKQMKNTRHHKVKTTSIIRTLGQILISVFVFELALSIGFAIGGVGWQTSFTPLHDYLADYANPGVSEFFVLILTFICAYSHLVPVSLYVALEIIKLIQAFFIRKDMDMYCPAIDEQVTVRTSELVEELGQIEFILTDKTGTLTKNEMKLKKFAVNGIIFGEKKPDSCNTIYHFNKDPTPFMLLCEDNPHKRPMHDFWTLLCICHSAVPDVDDKDPNKVSYYSSSPDEVAFLQAASQMGYQYYSRTSDTITIKLFGKAEYTWQLILEIPFDSARKRMAVIAKPPDTDCYMLLMKGADSVMFPRFNNAQRVLERAIQEVDKFAKEGLRTLVLGQKMLDPEHFDIFWMNYENIRTSNDRSKERKIFELVDQLEQEMDYVGVTAIEDKLQDNVPETISSLMEADIRFWMLTGDKLETALEVARECKMIVEGMHILNLVSKTPQELVAKLEKENREYAIENELSDRLPQLGELSKKMVVKIAVVLDGSTLAFVISEGIEEYFLKLAVMAHIVILCRVSPGQKAEVAELIKRNGPWRTLAIGDGANDVAMIWEADVGVGVHGKEGCHATHYADFSIGEFKLLKKLLLVHGRLGYKRISWFICYYFYKNIAIVFTEVYFAFFNGFSAQIYFADWLPMLFNALWTSWPCVITYSLERDVNVENSFKYPKLYRAGQLNYYFNMKSFWKWMIFAFWHGMVCFWIPVFGLSGVNDSTGLVRGHWWVSTVSFSLLMNIVTGKLYVECTYWNWFNLSIGIFSVFFYYITVMILCANGIAILLQPQLNGIIFAILGSSRAWIVLMFMPMVALAPDILYLLYQKMFEPTPTDKIIKLHRDNARKKAELKPPVVTITEENLNGSRVELQTEGADANHNN